jgi:hypothetical protein
MRPIPPAFTPAEAAQRLPREAWERTVRDDTHGKELVRYVAELELGTTYGPTRGVRLIAATLDPAKLKPVSTWYLATSLTCEEASPEVVDAWYRLRDWVEHCSKPVKHELGWADYQMRPERAKVRHWQLVLLAYTFSLLVGALPPPAEPSSTSTTDQLDQPTNQAEKKLSTTARGRVVWQEALRRVQAWRCPWARLRICWQRWSRGVPPPELAELLAHLARGLPLEAHLLDAPT